MKFLIDTKAAQILVTKIICQTESGRHRRWVRGVVLYCIYSLVLVKILHYHVSIDTHIHSVTLKITLSEPNSTYTHFGSGVVKKNLINQKSAIIRQTLVRRKCVRCPCALQAERSGHYQRLYFLSVCLIHLIF